MSNEETTPHRARRLGKEYAEKFHDRWSAEGRKWIRFAFAKGYEAACADLVRAVDGALGDWEYHRSQDKLVGALDTILDRYDTRPVVGA